MMQIILQIVGILFFMLIVPVGMGLLVMQAYPTSYRKPGMAVSAGYLCSFAVFEWVTMPIVIWTSGHNFITVKWVYTIVSVGIALFGYGSTYWKYKKKKESYLPKENLFPGAKAAWALALFILLYILCMAVTHMSFDGDDSYYVVQSLITQQTGTMYTIAPYTGGSTSLDVRHAMAVFTMWIAYMGSLCGIHTTILCHSVLPCVIIPLAFDIDLQIGRALLKDKEEMLPFFMIFMELLVLFGYVSMYTNETFLLTRTWQGKALAAGFLFPVTMWILLQLSRDVRNKGAWIMLVMVSMASGLFSSLAVLLCLMLVASSGFFLMLREKSFLLYVKMGCACIPAVIYMGLYLVVDRLR